MPDAVIHRRNWVEPREFASRPKGEGHFSSDKGVVELTDDEGATDTCVTLAGNRQSPCPVAHTPLGGVNHGP